MMIVGKLNNSRVLDVDAVVGALNMMACDIQVWSLVRNPTLYSERGLGTHYIGLTRGRETGVYCDGRRMLRKLCAKS